RGGEGHQLLAARTVGDLGEFVDRGDQLLGTTFGDLAGAVGGLGQPQRGLRRTHRRRVAAPVGIDHQQMHRVATHVENAQSHVDNLTGRRWLGSARPGQPTVITVIRAASVSGSAGPKCGLTWTPWRIRTQNRDGPDKRSNWISPANGWSSTTPTTPST